VSRAPLASLKYPVDTPNLLPTQMGTAGPLAPFSVLI
jgi:hypothetical protein